MITSSQITPGVTLSINRKLYRVESAVKVTVRKGAPFIKTKLRDLNNNQIIEKNFKLNESLQDAALEEKSLEFLYIEGKDFLFLGIKDLVQVLVPSHVIQEKALFLKEGVQVRGSFYGDTVFAIELPQFLELMVATTEGEAEASPLTHAMKVATLETGAKIEVPPFIESGDIIKVDTKTKEYIQRV